MIWAQLKLLPLAGEWRYLISCRLPGRRRRGRRDDEPDDSQPTSHRPSL